MLQLGAGGVPGAVTAPHVCGVCVSTNDIVNRCLGTQEGQGTDSTDVWRSGLAWGGVLRVLWQLARHTAGQLIHAHVLSVRPVGHMQ